MEDKLKQVEDMEKGMQLSKAEALKRERDEMLKWAKQAKKVGLDVLNSNYSKKNLIENVKSRNIKPYVPGRTKNSEQSRMHWLSTTGSWTAR